MPEITAPLDSQALQRLDHAAAQLQCSRDDIIQQALDRFLEDLEDPIRGPRLPSRHYEGRYPAGRRRTPPHPS